MNPVSARIGLAFWRTRFDGVAAVPSLWGADADEDVGVPVENFSPWLGVSVRGLRRINSLFLGNVLAPDFFGILQ